jgi:hypothetical protein
MDREELRDKEGLSGFASGATGKGATPERHSIKDSAIVSCKYLSREVPGSRSSQDKEGDLLQSLEPQSCSCQY